MRKLKKTKVKLLVTLLSFVLLFCGTMGSSLAWLLDKTDDVTNTFTPSTIGVTLTEPCKDNNPDYEFEMVPGHWIEKDPVVTVTAGSEDCWVFLKVEESGTLDQYIAYTIDIGTWKVLDAEKYPGVYVTNSPIQNIVAARELNVLGSCSVSFTFDNKGTEDTDDDVTETFSCAAKQVLTLPTVTETMMENVKKGTVEAPSLEFTAYAAQYWKTNGQNFTEEEAWNLAFANAN